MQRCQQGLQYTDLLTWALSVYLCCLLQTELGRISNTKASSVVGQWPEIIKQPFFLLNLSSFFFFSFWFAISLSCRVIYLPAVFNLRKNINLFKDYLCFIFAVHILSQSRNIRLCLVFMKCLLFSCSSFMSRSIWFTHIMHVHTKVWLHQVTEMSECVFVWQVCVSPWANRCEHQCKQVSVFREHPVCEQTLVLMSEVQAASSAVSQSVAAVASPSLHRAENVSSDSVSHSSPCLFHQCYQNKQT